MRVRVRVFGLLRAAVADPEGRLEITAPEGTDVAGLIALLATERSSSMFDARACLAVVDGARVPLSQVLEEGQEVGLYHTFSGG